MTTLILSLITIVVLSAATLFVVDAVVGAWERVTEVPEVATLATRPVGQILAAAGCGLFVLTMAYLAGRYGLWVLILSVIFTIAVLEAVSLNGRPPHGLRAALPPALGSGLACTGVSDRTLVGHGPAPTGGVSPPALRRTRSGW